MRTTLIVTEPLGRAWTAAGVGELVGQALRAGGRTVGRVVGVVGFSGREALLDVEVDAMTDEVMNVGLPAVSIRGYL